MLIPCQAILYQIGTVWVVWQCVFFFFFFIFYCATAAAAAVNYHGCFIVCVQLLRWGQKRALYILRLHPLGLSHAYACLVCAFRTCKIKTAACKITGKQAWWFTGRLNAGVRLEQNRRPFLTRDSRDKKGLSFKMYALQPSCSGVSRL